MCYNLDYCSDMIIVIFKSVFDEGVWKGIIFKKVIIFPCIELPWYETVSLMLHVLHMLHAWALIII